jgi:hypothetical protein
MQVIISVAVGHVGQKSKSQSKKTTEIFQIQNLEDWPSGENNGATKEDGILNSNGRNVVALASTVD